LVKRKQDEISGSLIHSAILTEITIDGETEEVCMRLPLYSAIADEQIIKMWCLRLRRPSVR